MIFWIIVFIIVGALLLWKGMKFGNRSCMADMGRLLLILAWMCILGLTFRSCVMGTFF